jgi:hypothetical protein
MTWNTPSVARPRVAWMAVGVVALATLALHLLAIERYGIFRDELYYLACSEHLAWGYVDQPPLIALIAWLVRHTLGDSLVALRLLPILASASCVFLTGLTAWQLGATRFGQVLAALSAAVAPVILSIGHILSMNVFDHLFWVLGAFLAARLLAGGRPWLWIVLGAVVGVGLLNKYSMGFFALALAVGVLLTPARRQLARKEPWIGAALATVLFAPHVAWEITHGLPTLEFMRNATLHKNLPLSPLQFLGGSAFEMHPFILPIWMAGVLGLLFARRFAPFRALGFIFPVVVGILLATHAKTYYLAPAYFLVLAAGGVVIGAWIEHWRRGWMRAAAAIVVIALLVGGGVLTASFALPLLSEEEFVRLQASAGQKPGSGERKAIGVLPQFFADMHGWENLAHTVAAVYHSLPPNERAQAAIFTSNYGEAGAIDRFGRRLGLPRAISAHNNYWLWGPRQHNGETVLVIGWRREDVERTFAEVELGGTAVDEWAMPYEANLPVFVCRKPRLPVSELWPRLRHYD